MTYFRKYYTFYELKLAMRQITSIEHPNVPHIMLNLHIIQLLPDYISKLDDLIIC